MRHPLTRTLALLVSLAGSVALHAEPTDWYQVELLIVEQPARLGADGEAWPPFPGLAYPEDGRFLIDPQRLQAHIAEHPDALASELDPRGRQVLTLPPLAAAWRVKSSLPPAADIPPTGGTPAASGSQAVVTGAASPAATRAGDDTTAASGSGAPAEASNPEPENSAAGSDTAVAADDPQAPPRLPLSHTLLPASGHEFRGKAAYMARNGGYRILFHERWWQPIPEGASPRPIILDHSGDGGSWPLLQGSVQLSRSRYLHVSTRLWLNTDGDTFPGEGAMPAPPRGPASLLTEQPDARALSWLLVPGILPARLDRRLFPAPPAAEMAPDWPWRHAVTLEQQRRMRSGEVHYLDHPRLGLIIKLTPLDSETLEAADYDRAWHHLTTGVPLENGAAAASGDTPTGVTPAEQRPAGSPAVL